MKSVAELLPGAMQLDSLVCRNCGEKVEFAPNQWRRPCRCGVIITQPELHKKVMKENERSPACFICDDKGIIYYQEQVGHYPYKHAARCVCKAGQERREKGIPRVDEVDNLCNLQYLEMKNRKAWEKRTGKKAEPALFSGSEVVQVGPEEIPF